ncbi:TatD family hydrolase [Spirochaeta lutea]|uniref:Hydrolase TatD n=1 Tax=Spirochaeta lutea TaxID=1480694 RepID=A0A098R4D2_9SPIO|nr:TatD family hydrolase [Spirochaeta lutea]KGE73627.1 hydrolase TatD [Spirochaeta lutea]
MKLFDTHAHIGLIHEDPIEQLIITQEARQQGVEGIISICNNLHDFFVVYENLRTATHVYHAVGVSPSEVQNPGIDWEAKIDSGVKQERVVAIGETGLDYYRKFGNKNSQIELFIRQLEIADKYNLPVIIHNRDAGKDILDILSTRRPTRGGVLHCYSEDWEFAKKAIDLGMYISFAGNATYRNARNLHETAKNIPIEQLVIESESPFMVPAEYRGKRNRPSYLHSTAEYLASLRGLDPEEFAEQTFLNAKRLFQL